MLKVLLDNVAALNELYRRIENGYQDGVCDDDVDRAEALVIESARRIKLGAYMPVPRCETCAHWTRFEIETAGECEMVKIPTAPACGDIETREDFGCVKWSAR